MRRAPDPAWIGIADRLFAAFLWLFPSDLRRDHGDEMRQVLRDRCREVAGQPARIAHLLFVEMLPDTVASASEAQWSAGIGNPRRRHGIALGVLLLAGGWLLFNDAVSRFVLDWGFEAKYWVENRQALNKLNSEEAQVRALADALAGEGTAASRAMSALLYHELYVHRVGWYVAGENRGKFPSRHYRADFDVLPEDGQRATRAVAASASRPQPAWIATLAVLSCEPEAGCDRGQAIDRLIRAEPDNAYAWAQAFKAAGLAGDEVAKRRALSRMAAATHYDDHVGAIRSALFAASTRLLPTDTAARAVVAQHVVEAGRADTNNFVHDARRECRSTTLPANWRASEPSIAADCLRFSRLLAASAGPWNTWLGWREIAAAEPTARNLAELERAKAFGGWQAMAIGASLSDGVDAQGHRTLEPWSGAEWNRWIAMWTPGSTEADATRAWLRVRKQSAPQPSRD